MVAELDRGTAQVRVELDDGSSVELADSTGPGSDGVLESSTGDPLRAFSGELPAGVGGFAVVAVDALGNEVEIARATAR